MCCSVGGLAVSAGDKLCRDAGASQEMCNWFCLDGSPGFCLQQWELFPWWLSFCSPLPLGTVPSGTCQSNPRHAEYPPPSVSVRWDPAQSC